MALKSSLLQSIAALDRITSNHLDPRVPEHLDSEKAVCLTDIPRHHYWHDEKLIRRRKSESSLVTFSEKAPSLYSRSMSSPREDPQDFEDEPKLTLRYIANMTLGVLTVALTFITPGIAITIIGLAADNIDWANGQGSGDANTVNAVVAGPYNATTDWRDFWHTQMLYVPTNYDTQTFVALIVAGVVCILGASFSVPLSVMYWRGTGRSVKLGRKTSQLKMLTACIAVEAIMLIVSIVVIIYDRELFTTYDSFDLHGKYTIEPQYLDPPLGPPIDKEYYHKHDRSISETPTDGIMRYYRSPMHYNPMNWNCRFQGHVTSSQQHRIWQLCGEGLAARYLLVALVALQGLVLASHAWSWWMERKAGGVIWTRQRLGSDERLATASNEGDGTHTE